MGEINILGTGKMPGVKRAKKLSTKVDLTPMVDLGFLLITFFVFTSALSEPNVMDLLQPNDSGNGFTQVCESCAITILAAADDRLYYYEGNGEKTPPVQTSYHELRGLMMAKKKKLQQLNRDAGQMAVIIKLADKAKLRNMVDMIDETKINLVKRYYFDELTEKEKRFLNN